jgi:hypothetical protein
MTSEARIVFVRGLWDLVESAIIKAVMGARLMASRGDTIQKDTVRRINRSPRT